MKKLRNIGIGFLTVISMFLYAGTAFAAGPAKDATSQYITECTTSGGCSGPITFTHTFGSITNGVFILAISSSTSDGIAITSITVGSNTLTLAKANSDSTTGTGVALYYAAVGTISGAKTVTINYTGKVTDIHSLYAFGISLSGANQTTPIDATAGTTNGASTMTPATSITTVTNNDFVTDVIGNIFVAISQGGSQTQIGNQSTCGNGTSNCGSSYLTTNKATAGSVSMTWTVGGGNTSTFAQSVIAIAPAAPTVNTNPFVLVKSGTTSILGGTMYIK